MLTTTLTPALGESCRLHAPSELVGCEYQKRNTPFPIKIVSSYENYRYENTFAMNEKNWDADEISLSNRHYSQICRSIDQTDTDDHTSSGRCHPKVIPRGSIVQVLRTIPHPRDNQATLDIVRVLSISNKYSGLSAKITKSMISSGEIGTMPSTYLKTPNLDQLFLDHDKQPLMIDRDQASYHQYQCGEHTYLPLYAMHHHQEIILFDNRGNFAQKFFDLNCKDKGSDVLQTSTNSRRAYQFLSAVNDTFSPNLAPTFSVGDFNWNEEGMVSFPYTQFQASDNPDTLETELPQAIKDLEGFGPQNRYFTYNQLGSEFQKHLDRWGTPHAVCSIFVLIQKWIDDACPNTPTNKAYCSPQVGDMAFHSPTVKSKADRSTLGLSKDPIGHRTHSSGNCIDVRLMAPNRFVHGADSSNDVKNTTNLFLKTAFEIGAFDLFYAYPNESTKEFVRIKHDHSDHVHFCFADPAARTAGYQQSYVSLTSLRESQNIAPLRKREIEALRSDPKRMSPFPIMSVRNNTALDECYSL